VERDAEAYAAVSAAYKLPKDHDPAARTEAIQTALLGAAEVPLETARLCAEAGTLAATVAAKGNANAITDAGVAALLAEAGCRGAAFNVRINVTSLADRSRGAHLEAEAAELVERAARSAADACSELEKALAN
jgi:glutamate formiminotransferase/formiminotetrahydrofolate cyclodeaminase